MTARLSYEPDLANVLGYPFLLMYPQSPNAVFDPNENKQRIHVDYDPTNSLSLDLKTKNMEVGTGGMPSTGTVTELEYKIGGKTYITATGLKIDAVELMAASQSGFSSFLSYLYDSFSGDIVGKGNEFGNVYEIGKGGTANIDGLAGHDTVYVWHQKNVTFDGGAGIDGVVFNYVVGSFPPPPNGVTIDLVTGRGTNPFGGKLDFSNVENIAGTQNADTISGNGKANVLYGGLGGEDVIDGRGGNDTISLAAGLNGAVKFSCDGGAGKDTFIYDISFGPASSRLDLAHPLNNAGAFAHAQINNSKSTISTTSPSDRHTQPFISLAPRHPRRSRRQRATMLSKPVRATIPSPVASVLIVSYFPAISAGTRLSTSASIRATSSNLQRAP
jgi:hypothetical protein